MRRARGLRVLQRISRRSFLSLRDGLAMASHSNHWCRRPGQIGNTQSEYETYAALSRTPRYLSSRPTLRFTRKQGDSGRNADNLFVDTCRASTDCFFKKSVVLYRGLWVNSGCYSTCSVFLSQATISGFQCCISGERQLDMPWPPELMVMISQGVPTLRIAAQNSVD